jgi:hypothetical protein
MEKYNSLKIHDSLQINADLLKVDEATNPKIDEESNLKKKLLHEDFPHDSYCNFDHTIRKINTLHRCNILIIRSS